MIVLRNGDSVIPTLQAGEAELATLLAALCSAVIMFLTVGRLVKHQPSRSMGAPLIKKFLISPSTATAFTPPLARSADRPCKALETALR